MKVNRRIHYNIYTFLTMAEIIDHIEIEFKPI